MIVLHAQCANRWKKETDNKSEWKYINISSMQMTILMTTIDVSMMMMMMMSIARFNDDMMDQSHTLSTTSAKTPLPNRSINVLIRVRFV